MFIQDIQYHAQQKNHHNKNLAAIITYFVIGDTYDDDLKLE